MEIGLEYLIQEGNEIVPIRVVEATERCYRIRRENSTKEWILKKDFGDGVESATKYTIIECLSNYSQREYLEIDVTDGYSDMLERLDVLRLFKLHTRRALIKWMDDNAIPYDKIGKFNLGINREAINSKGLEDEYVIMLKWNKQFESKFKQLKIKKIRK